MVDDGCHASSLTPVLVRHEILSLAEVEGRVLLLVQVITFAHEKVGHGTRVILIQFGAEIYKPPNLLLCAYFLYLYHYGESLRLGNLVLFLAIIYSVKESSAYLVWCR